MKLESWGQNVNLTNLNDLRLSAIPINRPKLWLNKIAKIFNNPNKFELEGLDSCAYYFFVH